MPSFLTNIFAMKTILIVDDDVTLKTVLTRHLEHGGYVVRHASSGVEALAIFERYAPDLIISDVLMPYMDGLELCRRIRALPTGQLVPFLFLSNCDDMGDRIQGHQIGADDYLVKPFQPQELFAKIQAQLERSQRIQSEMLRLVQQAIAAPTPQPEPLPFTPAEQKVFLEVIEGLDNRQIGDRLCLSPRTVQSHISSILKQLQLKNRSQLIRYAFEQGYHPAAPGNGGFSKD
jgi:DNA-binding NarL/FixJ family response regulator